MKNLLRKYNDSQLTVFKNSKFVLPERVVNEEDEETSSINLDITFGTDNSDLDVDDDLGEDVDEDFDNDSGYDEIESYSSDSEAEEI